jgi:ribosomal protein L23
MKVYKEDLKNADLLCLEMFRDSIMTEKSVNEEMKYNCMTFKVLPHITKNHIRIAIEAFFKTKVTSVRVINTKSKRKTIRGRKEFFTKTYKKVMVRVENFEAIQGGLNV